MTPRNPRTVCKDGFSLSVQAHEGAYCSPSASFAPVYTAVEVGFPSAPEPLLAEWQETDGDPCESIYPWTPVEVVRAVIAKHGGIVAGQCPAGVYPPCGA